MNYTKLFQMPFSKIYDCYIQKVERKWWNINHINTIIFWLTSYNKSQLDTILKKEISIQDFFQQAPQLHPNTNKITWSICGHKIQEIENPLMKKIRFLDKLIDELAQNKPLDKILRK